MRIATINRKTSETDVSLTLNLDGVGETKIDTGCGFLDHMLTLFASHGCFDLSVSCKGDVEVDYHHSVEDIGICLGMALTEALGDKKGIRRYGNMILPMDEALILTAIDLSGRDCFVNGLDIPASKIGDFDTELVDEFFVAFTRQAKMALHINQLAGKNSHHIVEGAFKSFARALCEAVEIDERRADKIPSTKGTLA